MQFRGMCAIHSAGLLYLDDFPVICNLHKPKDQWAPPVSSSKIEKDFNDVIFHSRLQQLDHFFSLAKWKTRLGICGVIMTNIWVYAVLYDRVTIFSLCTLIERCVRGDFILLPPLCIHLLNLVIVIQMVVEDQFIKSLTFIRVEENWSPKENVI